MIRVEDLTYGVPSKDLYKDISFTLEKGAHCALIGSNGAGKSTLADMLVNPDEFLYDGVIQRDEECRMGYASQYSAEDKSQECTVTEYLSQKFVEVQEAIAVACDEMANAEDLDAAFEKYQKLLDLNQAMDGDNFEANIHRQLYIAGMLDVKNVRVCEISGGEYKVLQIVREMLLSPDLLILDEPDAFLDFENQNSLCKLINEYKGTILVITHNRYLLNHCFNKILHLEGTAMQEYDGNYTEYRCEQLRQKLELKKQHLEQQEEIERTEAMVERMRKHATLLINPSAGRIVNAKQSQLDRLISRQIDEPFLELREPDITLPRFEKPDAAGAASVEDSSTAGAAEDINAAAAGVAEDINAACASSAEDFSTAGAAEDINAACAGAGDSVVLSASGYSVSFEKCILDNVNFEIKAGEKVAIIGANGAGKTTLVRDIIAGGHPQIHINENVKFAALSQLHNHTLDEKTVYQYMQDENWGGETAIRAHLKKYCLDYIDIHEKIGKLSVGEQNLLQIAALENSGADLLVLDEPTSHLDVYTQTALEAAINEYEGTVLAISHDFYLVADCMDYVLLIEDGTIRRMRARKFRKMVYDKFFDQKYLELDKRKQALEADIIRAYKESDIDKVDKLCDKLEGLGDI